MNWYVLRMYPTVLLPLAVTVFVVWLGVAVNPWYFAGLLLVLPLEFAMRLIERRRRDRGARANLARRWGKSGAQGRDRAVLRRAYEIYRKGSLCRDSLDRFTWDDLDMDDVFRRIDHTLTAPGALRLYEILRNPAQSAADLESRAALIRLYQARPEVRESLQLELALPGYRDPVAITRLLLEKSPDRPAWSHLYPSLTALAVAAFLSPVILPLQIAIPCIATMVAVNFAITYFVVRGYIDTQLQAIRHLGGIIRCGDRLAATVASLDPEAARLFHEVPPPVSGGVRKLQRLIALLFPERAYSTDVGQLLTEYFSALFLVEARAYNSIMAAVEAHRDELRERIAFAGEIDALIAVASFRASLPRYCEPDFHPVAKPLHIVNAAHLLLAEAVPNTIGVEDASPFVTGANMSGKTTFLKTVALNAALAQSVCTCVASAYRGGLYTIISSINIKDDIKTGQSFYYAELERMHAIIQSVRAGEPLLCVIDELLRGTNANERRAAASAILHSLIAPNAIALISSHDTDLARALVGFYKNYHFDSTISPSGLSFDYQLRDGEATTGNAIALMQEMGFPDDVVARANDTLWQARLKE